MFGADANGSSSIIETRKWSVYSPRKGTLLPCPKEGTTTIDLVKCFAGNYIGFNVSASKHSYGSKL
jgi:hypothetical protein